MNNRKINPDGTAGNARLGVGRGSNAGRSQRSSVNAKSIQSATKKKIYNPIKPKVKPKPKSKKKKVAKESYESQYENFWGRPPFWVSQE
jgi:hypothetical protein